MRSSAMRSIRIFLRPTAEGRKGEGRSARGAVRRGRVDRERLTARRSAKRAVGMLDRVGTRTGGGLDRRPIGAEGLGLGALGGIGHGATWVLRSLGSAGRTGEARQRVRAWRNELSGRQIGGSTPRGPARSRRGGGTEDEGTRDTTSTRAHASRRAGWNQPGSLRDATRVTRFGGSHAPRECVRLPKQQLCPSTPNRVAVRGRERVRAAWARLGSSGCVRARVTPSPGSACGAAVRCDANPDAKPVNIVVASSPSDAVESPRKSVSRKLTLRYVLTETHTSSRNRGPSITPTGCKFQRAWNDH